MAQAVPQTLGTDELRRRLGYATFAIMTMVIWLFGFPGFSLVSIAAGVYVMDLGGIRQILRDRYRLNFKVVVLALVLFRFRWYLDYVTALTFASVTGLYWMNIRGVREFIDLYIQGNNERVTGLGWILLFILTLGYGFMGIGQPILLSPTKTLVAKVMQVDVSPVFDGLHYALVKPDTDANEPVVTEPTKTVGETIGEAYASVVTSTKSGISTVWYLVVGKRPETNEAFIRMFGWFFVMLGVTAFNLRDNLWGSWQRSAPATQSTTASPTTTGGSQSFFGGGFETFFRWIRTTIEELGITYWVTRLLGRRSATTTTRGR